ncbi:MAG: pyridoxal kinase [Nitratireductor sp.]
MDQSQTQMSQTKPTAKKAVIVISSHVARGTIGNRAAVFTLETMGHPVWTVPTVILPWHPGHGPATKIVTPTQEFKAILNDLANAKWIDEVGAVLTGYMANEQQVDAVTQFIKTLKAKNKDIVHLCDPVMGDNGKLYVSEETAKAIKSDLVPVSNIITPNLFEFGYLNDKNITTIQEAIEASKNFPNQTMLITSIAGMMSNQIGNLLVKGKEILFAEHRYVNGPPNGSGDLVSALFIANMLEYTKLETVLQRTTAAAFEIIANSAKQQADELLLETNTHSFLRPMAMVQIRSMGLATQIRKAPKRKPKTT